MDHIVSSEASSIVEAAVTFTKRHLSSVPGRLDALRTGHRPLKVGVKRGFVEEAFNLVFVAASAD